MNKSNQPYLFDLFVFLFVCLFVCLFFYVGDLSVFDPDGTKTGYIYSMISLGTPFHIIGTGLHVERHPLDYEVTPVISVQMQVSEIATSLICTKTFHINITDIPEAPTSLTVDGNITVWVPETLTYPASLGTIMSNDPDHYDETMTFSFFNQQPVEFQIDGDQLMLVEGLDSWQRGLFDLPIQVSSKDCNRRLPFFITMDIFIH